MNEIARSIAQRKQLLRAHPIGKDVCIGPSRTVPATITAIIFRGTHFSYQIARFEGSDRVVEEVEAFEVDALGPETLLIHVEPGFE